MNLEICPICESGNLVSQSHTGEIEYKGNNLEVPGLEYSACQSCGADPVLADQARRNQVRLADAKRAADRLLRAEEIRAARSYLGLTQHAASSVFGGGLNAFSKYERGEVIQSEAMDKLIRVACHFPDVWNYLNVLARSESDVPLTLRSRESVRVWDANECFSFIPETDAVLGQFGVLQEGNDWEDQGPVARAA